MTESSERSMARRAFLEGSAVMGLASGKAPRPASAPLAQTNLYNVLDYGAYADKSQNSTHAFQAAIDAANSAGGGTVYVPTGDYLGAGIILKSHVTLYLENGATVYTIREPAAFGAAGPQLIYAKGAEFVSILGPGVFHGQATEDLGRRPGTVYDKRPEFRTRVIMLEDCRNLTLRDFTILYSDYWACTLRRCEKVVVEGVTVFNNYFHTNSDGIDPDSCRDVRISNCHVTAGDDCICLKTVGGVPCEDITITNCTTESVATAIKLGTGSTGAFRNITISNCTVRNSTVGLGLFIKDGGAIAGLTVSNLTIGTLDDPMQVNPERLRNMIFPIFIDIEKRRDDSRIGAIRDVVFSNIVIRSDNGILIQGMKESFIENLTLQNIVMRVTGPFDYADRAKHAGGTINPNDDRITLYARKPSYCTLANARNVTLDNVQVHVGEDVLKQFPRTAIDLHHVEGVVLRSIRRTPLPEGGPVIALHDVKEALVTNCIAPSGTGVFLRASAMRKKDLTLHGNDLRRAEHPVEWNVASE